MKESNIKAPQIQRNLFWLRDGKTVFDKKTLIIIDKIFDLIEVVKPCGEDNKRELWLKAQRGTIEDYGDYKQYKKDHIVKNKKEFISLWNERYPNETVWFNLITAHCDGFRVIYFERELIYQTKINEAHDPYECNGEEFFTWMLEAVKDSISLLEKGIYNDDVSANLDVRERTGTIARKDYWDIFPREKARYLEGITDEEIEKFASYISKQVDDKPVGNYLKEMSANDFYRYCSLGYKANGYKEIEGLTEREQYYKMADGRDGGLSQLDGDSNEEFAKWLDNRLHWSGHPFEVCAGGNSTHVDLFVRHNEDGYYFEVAGKFWTRSVEAIKFYVALRESGVAVSLRDGQGIKERALGQGIIGIVPKRIYPFYCESWFPGMYIIDFMHLPDSNEDVKKMIDKVVWIPEEKQYLK